MIDDLEEYGACEAGTAFDGGRVSVASTLRVPGCLDKTYY